MNQCIAITKKGSQCSKTKSQANSKLFCTIHIRSIPDKVILEGLSSNTIDFIDEANYFATIDKINKDNNERARVLKQKELDKYQAIHSCIVCNDDLNEHNALLKCSNSSPEYPHLICKDCLKGHINSQLSDGIASLECMFHKGEQCGGQYTEDDIQNAIGIEDMTRWRDVMTNTEIIKLAGVCENYLICPLCCRWGCIFEIPVGAEKLGFGITCGNCKDQWCTLCKRAWHPNRTCYEIIFSDKERDPQIQAQVIDKMIENIATRALTHCCSICGCQYIKEEGCNLMTCPKCNGMSCFICNAKLYYKGDTKYWHFTGHDKADPDARCPLWNNFAGDGKSNQGNTEYNLKAITQEFIHFAEANKKQRDIVKLICSRILKIYEKDKPFLLVFNKYVDDFTRGHIKAR